MKLNDLLIKDSFLDSSNGNDPHNKKKKKARTTFSGRQIFELEKQFEAKKYLSSSERAEIASLLNVTETQVRIRNWENVLLLLLFNFLK
jgi:hypothetical protein